MSTVLTITDRERGEISPPVYFEDGSTLRRLVSAETDTLTLHVKKGVTYTINTAGNTALVYSVSGFTGQKPVNIGSSFTFTATSDTTLSIQIYSPAGGMLPGGMVDRPHYGGYAVDVFANVPDDVGLTLPGDELPLGLPLKGRLGTASDSDQAFLLAPQGANGFFAAYSAQVRDLRLEIESSAGSPVASTGQDSRGMAVLAMTAPADDYYKVLVRSGSYRQEGEYEFLAGQRIDPGATFTIGKPTGDVLIFSGNGNREVWAWGGQTQIQTGGGHDTLVGSMTGSDVLSAGAGDDTIIGLGGVNIVDGGAGRDTYMVLGNAEDYQIVKTSNGLQLQGSTVFEQADKEGNVYNSISFPSVDLVSGIEYVKFLDKTLDVVHARWLRDWVTIDRTGTETYKGFEGLSEGRVYQGKRSEYMLTIDMAKRANQAEGKDPYDLKVVAAGAGATDTLWSVERLLFDDGGIAVDMYPGGVAHNAVKAMLFAFGAKSLKDQFLAGRVVEFFHVHDGITAAAGEIYKSKLIPGAQTSDKVLVDYVIATVAGNSGRWLDANGVQTPIDEWRESALKKLASMEWLQSDLIEMALMSPDMDVQVALTGIATTGLYYQDAPIPWGG